MLSHRETSQSITTTSPSTSRTMMSPETSPNTSLTAESLVDLPVISAPRVSPVGKHVVYSACPWGRKTPTSEKSALWLAEYGKPDSARQLTSGSHNDRAAEWCPTDTEGATMAFLSDRGRDSGGETKAKDDGSAKSCAIFIMNINRGEAYAVTDVENEAEIEKIAWSADGKWLAFLSADEKTAKRKARDEEHDDVQVYGEDWRFNRLRVFHVATREVRTLVCGDRHVQDFSWSSDENALVYATVKTTELESGLTGGTRIAVINVTGQQSRIVCEFPGSLSSLVWVQDKNVLFKAGLNPNMISTSNVCYRLSLSSGNYDHIAYGHSQCLQNIRPMGGSGEAVVHVLNDLSDEITVFGDYDSTYNEQEEITAYDMVKMGDQYYFAFISSTVANAPEVYSMAYDDGAFTKLSNHGAIVNKHLAGVTFKHLESHSFDRKASISAVQIIPAFVNSPFEPFPTVVHLHGGPYYRVTDSFDGSHYRWWPWLVAHGYSVLSVNYRGSSGRGNNFAEYAAGGMGTVEYDDVLAVVDWAIKEGIVDKNRLIVAGWSQGGFLSYLSAVRNGADTLPNGKPKGWHYRGAICGAGVTDWDMMSMSSDVPAFESELGGGTPWGSKDKHWTGSRQGSAIWEFAKAKDSIPPVLILHGAKDERVPVTQAMAFHRGCLKWGVNCEMAVYPREPHLFKERAHLVDLLKRVARFVDTHMAT